MASYLDKGFWRETKITSSEGRTKPRLTGSALSLPRKKSLGAPPVCPPKAVTSSHHSLPSPAPRQLVRTISFFKQLRPICWHREIILRLHMYPSPFYKDGFKPRCLQERGWNGCVHHGIQKCSLGENAIIFDKMGEGQEPSSISYCRYDFLTKSAGKAACSFCFYSVNSKVAKVI